MAALHPPAAVLTGAECDPKLADDDPRDRQFFLELGGHACRADLSTASRTARRQRCVVADIDPGWPAPACRLAVLGAGSSAWAFGSAGEGLGEGSGLAIPGASRRIELSSQAGVLLLEPFDTPLQPLASTLRLFELALHACVLLLRRPGRVLLAAGRAHTRLIGTCAFLCTRTSATAVLRRLAPRFRQVRRAYRADPVTNYERKSLLDLLNRYREQWRLRMYGLKEFVRQSAIQCFGISIHDGSKRRLRSQDA